LGAEAENERRKLRGGEHGYVVFNEISKITWKIGWVVKGEGVTPFFSRLLDRYS
jgi:hypothetical protein